LLLAGCAADMPAEPNPPMPAGFVAGPRKEIVGAIRLTSPTTLGRESSFAASGQMPKDGQIRPMGFVASSRSEVDLRPGANIAGKMKQTGLDVDASDARMDRGVRAALQTVVFTSTLEWDPQCKTPSFKNFESSDKTARASDMQAMERILTILDGDILACFQQGVRVGNFVYVPARDLLHAEFLGLSTEHAEGSVRVRIEGIGTFDGREAISVALAGSPQLKGSVEFSGRYDGNIVFDAQTGIILSLEIATAFRGIAAGGREARYNSTRTVRVREIRDRP